MKYVVLTACLLLLVSGVKRYEPVEGFRDDGKCRALSFQAGGVKGAYEAGALKALIENLPEGEAAYDVVSGVSAGSINAAAISFFKKGDEKAAIDFLEHTIWDKMTPSKGKASWTGGVIQGMLFKGALYDNSPVKQSIKEYAEGKQIQRQLFISSCDANTAEYIVFDGSNMTIDELPTVCQASTAIPGVFPPVELNGRVLIDGGSVWSINAFSAIEGCRRLGYSDSDIILDLLMNSHAELNPDIKVESLGTLDIYFRYLDITNYYKILDFVQMIPLDYPEVNVRYVVHPDKPLSAGLGVSFNHDDVERLLEAGYADGQKAIAAGQSHLTLLQEYGKMFKSAVKEIESYGEFRARRLLEMEA